MAPGSIRSRSSSTKAVAVRRTKQPVVDAMTTASDRAYKLYKSAKHRHARQKAEAENDDVVLPDVPDPTSALAASNRYAAKETTFERADRHVKLSMQANAIVHKVKAVVAGQVRGADVAAVVAQANHLLWCVEAAHIMGWTLETTQPIVERVLRRIARDALKAEAAAAARRAGPVTTTCVVERINAQQEVVLSTRKFTTTPEGIAKKEKRRGELQKIPETVRLAPTREPPKIVCKATGSRNSASGFNKVSQEELIMTLENGEFEVSGDPEHKRYAEKSAAILRREKLGLGSKRVVENRHVYVKPSGAVSYQVRGDDLQNLLATEVFEVEGPVSALVFKGFASRAEAHDFRDDVEEFLDGDGGAFPDMPGPHVTGPHVTGPPSKKKRRKQ